MDRRFALILAVITICAVLVLPVAALAQDKQSKEADSSDGFALLHMLKQGETVKYKLVQMISGTRSLPGTPRPTQIDCELVSVVAIRCVKVLSDSSLEISAETESATVRLAGRDPRNMGVSKEKRIYRISQYGNPVAVKGSKTQADPVSRSVLDSVWLESFAILSVFPEKALNTGSDWSLDAVNPLQTDGKIKVSAKIAELKETKDGWITTIKETIGLPQEAQPEMEPDRPGSRIEGQVVLKFLADKGRMFAAEGTVKTESRTSVPMPGTPDGDLPMGSAESIKTERFTCKFSVETIPSTSVSKPSGQK